MNKQKTNHTADELFAKARQQGLTFSPEKLETMLTNYDDAKAKNGTIKKSFIQTHLKLIIMTSILTIIGISLSVFLTQTPANKQAQKDLMLKKQTEANANIIATNNKQHDNKTALKTSKEAVYTETSLLTALTEIAVIKQEQPENPVNQQPPTDSVTTTEQKETPPSFNGDEYILDLTNEDLEKLGIVFQGDNVLYQNKNSNNIISQFAIINEKKGDTLTSYYPIANPDFDKELSIVKTKIPQIDEMLALQITTFMQSLRLEKLNKIPGIAETLDWATALSNMHFDHLDKALIESTLGVILKDWQDIRHTQDSLSELMEKVGISSKF